MILPEGGGRGSPPDDINFGSNLVCSSRRRFFPLPSSDQWLYELKLDGYRAIAFKREGTLHLRSRNNKDFSARYPAVVTALATLPDDTVIDGEIVALDQHGRPSFNALQNYGSAPAPVVYYVFDVLVLAGRDVMREPLEARGRCSNGRYCRRCPSQSGTLSRSTPICPC